jgi:hypothetical protein
LQLGKSLVEFADKEEGACVNRRRSWDCSVFNRV